MKIFFMGTPEFAAESLKSLISGRHEVCGVFCQPDRAKGRGMQMEYCPVKKTALDAGIPVFQPVKMRDGEALGIINSFKPDILVVVAYGKILPDDILNAAPYGAINVHGSLLPAYRGAAPIQWSVINGDRVTGVTTMHLATEMDTGDMIYRAETEIGEFETSGELYDRLAVIGAELLTKTLDDLENGTAPRIVQDHSKATYVTMLDKSMSPVDFNRSPRSVVKQIYGLQPWPVATAVIGGETLRLFAAAYSENRTDRMPGEVVSAGKNGIEIACANGETVYITEVQAPGKKRIKSSDYIRGHAVI